MSLPPLLRCLLRSPHLPSGSKEHSPVLPQTCFSPVTTRGVQAETLASSRRPSSVVYKRMGQVCPAPEHTRVCPLLVTCPPRPPSSLARALQPPPPWPLCPSVPSRSACKQQPHKAHVALPLRSFWFPTIRRMESNTSSPQAPGTQARPGPPIPGSAPPAEGCSGLHLPAPSPCPTTPQTHHQL